MSKRILIIDDDLAVRDTLIAILEDRGYEVMTAVNGQQGLAVFRSERPDLLVTDIVMPHMLGTEVAEIMRVIKPGAAELYMSGYAWPVYAPQTRLRPDVILVDKPFSDADLLAKAGQALADRNRELRTSRATRA